MKTISRNLSLLSEYFPLNISKAKVQFSNLGQGNPLLNHLNKSDCRLQYNNIIEISEKKLHKGYTSHGKQARFFFLQTLSGPHTSNIIPRTHIRANRRFSPTSHLTTQYNVSSLLSLH